MNDFDHDDEKTQKKTQVSSYLARGGDKCKKLRLGLYMAEDKIHSRILPSEAVFTSIPINP